MEVRFAAEEKIREQIETAVEDALLREGLLRSSAPRGKSAPEQATIRPDSSDSSTLEEAESSDPGSLEDEKPDSTDGFGTESTGESHPEGTEITESEPVENEGSTSTGMNEPRRSTGTEDSSVSTGSEKSSLSKQYDSSESSRQADARGSAGTDQQPVGSDNRYAGSSSTRKFGGAAEQTKLGEGDAEETQEFDSLPPMRVLGQLEETYIAAETEDGMVLIDQHAADERIHYERLRETFEGDTTTQALAEPVEVELTAREAELFDAHEDALATLGFHASLVDDRTVRITTIPSLIAEAAGPELIRDILGEFVTGKDAAGATIEATADGLLADLACYPSITGNTSLTDGSVIELLSTLDECTNPYACPHGRPVIVEFDTAELEARFERDYPGHGG